MKQLGCSSYVHINKELNDPARFALEFEAISLLQFRQKYNFLCVLSQFYAD